MKHPTLAALTIAAALASINPAIAKQKFPPQPPPPAVPVGDVESAPLEPPVPPILEGSGRAIDGDEIAIGDVIFRLEGIAAPLMTVPMGPEARVALQALIDGQRLTCNVIDRAEDARHLSGTCSVGGDDLAEAMLAGGMAAVYRQDGGADAQTRQRAARHDAAETEARGRGLGIWATEAADIAIEPAPPPEPDIDSDVLSGWLVQVPLLGFAAIAGIITLFMISGGRRERREQEAARMQSLLALLLAEVLAIRASAEAVLRATGSLIQDLPIPTAQLANLALPPATVFAANAGRLMHLPREVSVDLVQFHARHAIVSRILGQAGPLRCEQLRAALEALVSSADEPVSRAEKLLG